MRRVRPGRRAQAPPDDERARLVLVVHASAELYGSDRALVESVRALRNEPRPVLVALPEAGPLVEQLVDLGAHVRVVPTLVLRKADISPGGLVRVALRVLQVLPGNVRLVRTCGASSVYVNTVAVPMWLPLAAIFGLPSLCHVHEAEEGLPRPVALLLTLPLFLARRVVVNSRAARAVLLRTCPRLAGRTTVVYNCVPGPDAEPTSLGERGERPLRLVLVGRLSHRKGTDVAVAAIAELRRQGVRATLRLVGSGAPGTNDYETALREQVQAAGLADVVEFCGFEPNVWPSLDAAEVVLVPSRLEPFGNVAVEAALARRPVLASRVQGLQEIVRHGETGLLVEPDDPAALADAIAELLDDWPRARAMAVEAERQARERFGAHRYGRDLRALVEPVLLPGPSSQS